MVNPLPEPVEPPPPPADAAPRTGRRVSPKLIVGVVIAAVVIWFAFANTRDARITFWLKTYNAPVWLVLLATFVAGLLAGWLIRRRRR